MNKFKTVLMGFSLVATLLLVGCSSDGGSSTSTEDTQTDVTQETTDTTQDTVSTEGLISTGNVDVVFDGGSSVRYQTSRVDSIYGSISATYFTRLADGSTSVTISSDPELNPSGSQSTDAVHFGFTFENNSSITTGTVVSTAMMAYIIGDEEYNNAWQSSSVPFTPFDVLITSIDYDGVDMHVVGEITNFILTEQNTLVDKEITINFDVNIKKLLGSE